MLAFGTNGEAVLLSTEERRSGLELWLEAVAGRMLVAAHCGAQTTADTVALAAHAAEAGADAVAVIGPPYFKLDPPAQRMHLLAAAAASPGTAQARDKDCGDFGSQAAAQYYFDAHDPRHDPDLLDGDHDGVACESNPCPCDH